MGEWVWPANVGIFGGLGLFVLLLLPIVVVQYRRYGRFTWLRFLGAAGLAVYGVALLAYTLLPLPALGSLQCPPGGSSFQWVPFSFVDDIQRETEGLGLAATLTSRATLQVVFNIVLFLPWGVIVRRYFSRGTLFATSSGFAASTLIEITQFTGLWGVYDCAYRVADIDDLFTNTLGALVGALIAPFVLWFMPRQQELMATRGNPRPVTVWRRWLGMIVDYGALSALGYVLLAPYKLLLLLTNGELPSDSDPISEIFATLLPGFFIFYLPALTGSGASFGQRVVWLEPYWEGSTLAKRVVRATIVGGTFTVCTFASNAFPDTLFDLASFLILIVAFVSVPFTRGKRGLSGTLSGAEISDSRASKTALYRPVAE